MEAWAGDGTKGADGGTEDLANGSSSTCGSSISNSRSSSMNSNSSSTCSSSFSNSSGGGINSSCSSMEWPGVVNSFGNRGGARPATVAAVEAKRHPTY